MSFAFMFGMVPQITLLSGFQLTGLPLLVEAVHYSLSSIIAVEPNNFPALRDYIGCFVCMKETK